MESQLPQPLPRSANTIDASLELKFLSETGEFEGYASVFNVADRAGDTVAPGAFAASLAAARKAGRLPPLLWQHDPAQPIGAWREMREDAHGLYVKGTLFTADIPRAREAYRLLKERVVTGLSIGYRATGARLDEKGARVLTEIELVEVSMVTFPANEFARVRRVKSALRAGRVPDVAEFEAFLRDAGLSRKQARGVIAQGYKSLGYKSLNRCDAGGGIEDTDDVADAVLQLANIIRDATP